MPVKSSFRGKGSLSAMERRDLSGWEATEAACEAVGRERSAGAQLDFSIAHAMVLATFGIDLPLQCRLFWKHSNRYTYRWLSTVILSPVTMKGKHCKCNQSINQSVDQSIDLSTYVI